MMPEITIKISMQEEGNKISMDQGNDSPVSSSTNSFNIEPPSVRDISDWESELPGLPDEEEVNFDRDDSIPQVPEDKGEAYDYELNLPPIPEDV